jgi:hypothetical protein
MEPTVRIDLTESTIDILDKIDKNTYLLQFDVSLNYFYLFDRATNTQYNIPADVQFELDSRYWRYRDPAYWEANYNK